MAKPVKGKNSGKRAPSDKTRIAKAHLNALKFNTAIVDVSFEVPSEGFKTTKISATKVRIKGVGAGALKASKGNPQVVKAIANREWNRVVSLVPYEEGPISDYECKKKVDDFGNVITSIKKEVVIKKNKATNILLSK
jgi:hypothetical protein